MYAWTDNQFRRTLVMAIGSYFEHEITEVVGAFVERETQRSEWVIAFAKSKGISRQYHTYFKWSDSNVNQFFAMFGPACRARHAADVRDSDVLKEAVKAFLQLGDLRNTLAHLNFATYVVEKTAAEVYAQFRVGVGFLDYVETLMETYSARPRADAETVTVAVASGAQPDAPPAAAPPAVPDNGSDG
jgi:hypothetical protein